MYRKINTLVIPESGFKAIADAHRTTQVHNLYHVSGVSQEMKEAMGNMAYKEVGKGENDITVKTPVPKNTNILLINPTNDILTNPDFLSMLDQIEENCYVIAVLQDTHLKERPMPYDDSTLPFFGKLREKFILTSTKRITLKNDRRFRYDDEVDHYFTIYLLGRADVKKKNEIDEGEFVMIEGRKTEYIPKIKNGFPEINSPLNFQHPVKSIRRMPVLLRPLGNTVEKRIQSELNRKKALEETKDKTYDIKPDRDDSYEKTSWPTPGEKLPGTTLEGFVLSDRDEQLYKNKHGNNFTNGEVKTYKTN